MEKHYRVWLNEKIPALNGQTPMAAVKTKEGKNKVIELLRSIENFEKHNKRKGRPYYDISWMWERLRGLIKNEGIIFFLTLPSHF